MDICKELIGFLFLSFLVIVMSKSVDLKQEEDIFQEPFSCRCVAKVANSTAQHDLGEVKVIVLKHHTTSTSPCHALRHRCHKACTSTVSDLTRKIGGASNRETLGYRLCMNLENSPDTPHGGYPVSAHASLHAPAQCSDHHGDALKAEVTSARLCCRHSYVTLTKYAKPSRVYGWNPDCTGTEYVLGY